MSYFGPWSRKIYEKYGGRDFFGGPPPGTREHAEWKAGRDAVIAASGKKRVREDSGVASTPKKPKTLPVSSKKRITPDMGGNINNKLVGKSVMTVKGKLKVKKRKVMKISKKFRASVKQVLTGAQARGTYTTLRQGFVGSLVVNGLPGSLSQADMGSVSRSVLLPATTIPTGSRTLWNCLAIQNPAANPTLLAESNFNYFTPAKILDAASVLFNGKAAGDPYIKTGNLSEVVVSATGAPQVALPTLKIDIINSSVVWRMKNVSNRIITVEIWECTPKIKFGLANPLESLYEHDQLFTLTTNDNPTRYLLGAPGAGGLPSKFFYHEQAFDPLQVAKNMQGFPWTWRKRTIIMNPEETCVHTIKGPRGILDFRKLVNSASDGVPTVQQDVLLKGFSVGCILSVVGDQVLKPNAASTVGGRDAFASATATAYRLGMPISLEIEEKYRIAVPEIAGYINNGAAAGAVQSLNLRKHRYMFWNTVGAQAATDTVASGYIISNEENPVASTTGGVFDQ